MQLNVGHLDEAGVYTNSFTTFALCGQLRIKVGAVDRFNGFDGSQVYSTEARVQLRWRGGGSADQAGRQLPAACPCGGFPRCHLPHLTYCPLAAWLQGEGDSALDHLWAAKRAEIGQ